jgi:hypothetical protein
VLSVKRLGVDPPLKSRWVLCGVLTVTSPARRHVFYPEPAIVLFLDRSLVFSEGVLTLASSSCTITTPPTTPRLSSLFSNKRTATQRNISASDIGINVIAPLRKRGASVAGYNMICTRHFDQMGWNCERGDTHTPESE